MPNDSTVLDIGGGPGRYSQALAERGHTVDLFDLSPKSVEFAKRLADKEVIAPKSFHVGNAVDLSRFPDASYDVVLNMGPLYHLVEEDDRYKAISESVRVLRPGGLIAVSFISTFAHVYDMLNKDPSAITEHSDLSERCRDSRTYLENEKKHFTDGYVVAPFQVNGEFRDFPLEKLSIIGAEGIVAHSESQICQLGEPAIGAWIKLCTEIADTDAAIASSIHLVYFGRKAI